MCVYRDYDNQKSWIIELLAQQGVALIDRQVLIASNAEKGHDETAIRTIKLTEELRFVYRNLQKWIDLNDEKVEILTN